MSLKFLASFSLAALLAAGPTSVSLAQNAPAPAAPSAQQTTPPATPAQPAPAPARPSTPPPAGQASGSSQDQSQYTIKQYVDEVDLVFTVSDRHGKHITDLKQSDFALLDDGRAPDRIYSFTQETNLPLRLGIIVDTSTSIRQRFMFEQQAATEFLLQILRPNTDKAFVEGFDIAPDFKQGWTNDLDALTQGVEHLHSGGGTAMYDALYTGCHDRMLDATLGHEPARKAIVLISDGDDNQSHAYLDDAIKECQRADTIVYAISTNVSPSRDRGDDTLQKIADATGGRAFYPTRIEDMPVSFGEIQQEIRSQYALIYKPANFVRNGAFRTIYLFCLDRKYTVRGPKGYFAPTE